MDRPEMAVLVANTFAVAAEIEASMGNLLATFLGSEAEAALAMYSSLRSAPAQRDSLAAVAKLALSQEDFKLFTKAQRSFGPALDHRNRFAHWIWASDPEDKDCLCFVNPIAKRAIDTALRKIVRGDATSIDEFLRLDEVLVYTKSDVEDVNEALSDALEIVEMMHECFAAGANAPAQARAELSLALHPRALTDLRNTRRQESFLEFRPTPKARRQLRSQARKQ